MLSGLIFLKHHRSQMMCVMGHGCGHLLLWSPGLCQAEAPCGTASVCLSAPHCPSRCAASPLLKPPLQPPPYLSSPRDLQQLTYSPSFSKCLLFFASFFAFWDSHLSKHKIQSASFIIFPFIHPYCEKKPIFHVFEEESSSVPPGTLSVCVDSLFFQAVHV